MTDPGDAVGLDGTTTAADPPDQSSCTEAEWRARIHLAALYRAIHLYGMSDLVNGAIAARVPDQPDHYLTHPYGMFWEEATASSFITIAAADGPMTAP